MYICVHMHMYSGQCIQSPLELKDGLQHTYVPANQCHTSPGTLFVEGDASSTSYFVAGATITGGTVTVEGCGSESLQGGAHG